MIVDSDVRPGWGGVPLCQGSWCTEAKSNVRLSCPLFLPFLVSFRGAWRKHLLLSVVFQKKTVTEYMYVACSRHFCGEDRARFFKGWQCRICRRTLSSLPLPEHAAGSIDTTDVVGSRALSSYLPSTLVKSRVGLSTDAFLPPRPWLNSQEAKHGAQCRLRVCTLSYYGVFVQDLRGHVHALVCRPKKKCPGSV